MSSKSTSDFEDLIDDDGRTLYSNVNPASSKESSPCDGWNGRNLGLALPLKAESKGSEDSRLIGGQSYGGVQENDVNVVFDLPDGSQGEGLFKLGHTIELLKSFVECEYGIPMADQDMFMDEKLLMNPLSLLDYPEAKGMDEIFIRVEGPLPADCKK